MLNQVTKETLEIFKDKPIFPRALNFLRRMKPRRQVEAAEFMVSTENFSRLFAQALFYATRPQDRTAWRGRPMRGLTHKKKFKMQIAFECWRDDSKATEGHCADVLNLVVASGYVSRLIGNQAIENYLGQHHSEILEEFKRIVSAASLNPPPVEASVDYLS